MVQPSVPDQREFRPHSSGPAGAGPLEPGLRLYADAFFEGATPALITVMNRSVGARVTAVEATTPTGLLAQTPLPWVVVKVSYQRGLTGTHALILPLAAALALGHGVLGTADGEELEYTAACEDALKELVSQMLSGATATLAPLLRRSVSFAPVSTWLAEDDSAIPPELEGTRRTWVMRAELQSTDGLRATAILTAGEDLATEIGSITRDATEPEPEPTPVRGGGDASRLDLILDIALPVTVELGRARMQIQDILKLGPGSVIELEKSAGDPVELYINDRAIARGEVVVIDENFGVRLTSIVTAAERIRTLR
jgi:flagellar motor switch protein FliN/FliY